MESEGPGAIAVLRQCNILQLRSLAYATRRSLRCHWALATITHGDLIIIFILCKVSLLVIVMSLSENSAARSVARAAPWRPSRLLLPLLALLALLAAMKLATAVVVRACRLPLRAL
eukprot:COSAG02_NODE_2647_length_8336_cov_10.959087_3_plen_116_part_00